MNKISEFFLHDAKPFSDRREVKWNVVRNTSITVVVIAVVGLLFMPEKKVDNNTFHESTQNGSMNQSGSSGSDPTDEAARQLNQARGNMAGVPSSLDYLYQSQGSAGHSGSAQNKNSAMILTRDGTDTRGSLSAGTRIAIRLTNRIVISNQAMPVIGVITSDVTNENDVAITKGTKVLGTATFDDTNERAAIDWKTIILSDGRERPFQAIGVSQDGQAGIEGKVSSNAFKNTVGETITQFIGAYAQGSMSQGAFGASEGGVSNGLKSAVAQTAKERASGMAETMKKEKKWIEINAGTDTLAVLSQSFAFKDPGAIYGR
jgi:hypothetical protein